MQIPLRTLSSVDAYIRNREWRDARLSGCPLHPSGSCSFARHGSYARVTPRGLRIARWYCPEGRTTFSLLPDFLAARLPGLLASIEDSISVASSAKSVEAAADALRGPDVSLTGAVRWLRRRIRAVRTALAHIAPETMIGALAMESAPGIDPDKRRILVGLRRSLSAQMLTSIPAPLGFQPAWGPGRTGQHGMGPDGEISGLYGPVIDGSQARWNLRSNNALPKARPPPKICSGSGGQIAACKTAAPAFTSNGSSGSASIVRDKVSMSAPS
ncbi:MAG: hypothetical protein WDO24_12750 [Pseudomonadota bacterium]